MEKFKLPAIDIIKAAIVPKIRGIVWRVVECQEEIATLELVETLEEQATLEGLLEKSKPSLPENCHALNYLLATPFRYPPLKWGSRFGHKHEPSLFYGSENIPTALAETAYYRVLFWAGMDIPPSSGVLKTQHTIYSVKYECSAGLYLHKPPFEEYQGLLQHPQDYRGSQKLGTIIRGMGVDGFQFISARCPNKGLNIALFTPAALAGERPDEKQNWICETAEQYIMFSGQGKLFKFDIEDFQINGETPLPAS